MGWLATVGRAVYELLVDDGQMAVGVLAALVLIGVWSLALAPDQAARDLGGPLLFVALMALLAANSFQAGRRALRLRE
ncbi:MAG: hypothetical protein ACRDGT_03905 [Candidatus Limnocylindria bacterium]